MAGEAARSEGGGFERIAFIDDAFVPVALDRFPAEDREQVLAALNEVASLADLLARGFSADAVKADPDAALDSLTLPSFDKGEGYASVAAASSEGGRIIDERHALRRIVQAMETASGKAVVQCDPFNELPDLTGCQLVMIDYYLEGSGKDGELAKAKAWEVQRQNADANPQQIVLMSSLEGVRKLRQDFRAEAGIAGASYAFVAKSDMDERWKASAHLAMLARALPYSGFFAEYRKELEQSIDAARGRLLTLIDDLDIGDYAFIQNLALSQDGHPLGDYLAWLFSSHLTALAFEDRLREAQATIDKFEFDAKPMTSTEPSPEVATLFHSALLSRNVGPLLGHPRAHRGGRYENVPYVRLGDVFFDKGRSRAFAVVSADCDLAFAPNEARSPDEETPVMLVPGETVSFRGDKAIKDTTIAGMLQGTEVFRIDWYFEKHKVVELGRLREWLTERGFDLTERERLRPMYALKLQQEFGAHLLRVGPPIAPPTTWQAKGSVFLGDVNKPKELYQECDLGDVMVSKMKETTFLHLTPKLVGIARHACEELLARHRAELSTLTAAKAVSGLQRKIDALERQLADDDVWIGLVDKKELASFQAPKSEGPISIVRGPDWTVNKPGVVMQVEWEVAGEAAFSS